jgi:hypothetical protein
MTTFAADQHTSRQLEELDARLKTAWDDYRTSTSQLAGPDYEETELVSWDRLQRAISELADERERLVATAPAGASDDAG